MPTQSAAATYVASPVSPATERDTSSPPPRDPRQPGRNEENVDPAFSMLDGYKSQLRAQLAASVPDDPDDFKAEVIQQLIEDACASLEPEAKNHALIYMLQAHVSWDDFPLYIAVTEKNTPCVRVLLNAVGYIGNTSINPGYRDDILEHVMLLNGRSLTRIADVSHVPYMSSACLIMACRNGDYQTVEVLLEATNLFADRGRARTVLEKMLFSGIAEGNAYVSAAPFIAAAVMATTHGVAGDASQAEAYLRCTQLLLHVATWLVNVADNDARKSAAILLIRGMLAVGQSTIVCSELNQQLQEAITAIENPQTRQQLQEFWQSVRAVSVAAAGAASGAISGQATPIIVHMYNASAATQNDNLGNSGNASSTGNSELTTKSPTPTHNHLQSPA